MVPSGNGDNSPTAALLSDSPSNRPPRTDLVWPANIAGRSGNFFPSRWLISLRAGMSKATAEDDKYEDKAPRIFWRSLPVISMTAPGFALGKSPSTSAFTFCSGPENLGFTKSTVKKSLPKVSTVEELADGGVKLNVGEA